MGLFTGRFSQLVTVMQKLKSVLLNIAGTFARYIPTLCYSFKTRVFLKVEWAIRNFFSNNVCRWKQVVENWFIEF
jgi:hypothetical protein